MREVWGEGRIWGCSNFCFFLFLLLFFLFWEVGGRGVEGREKEGKGELMITFISYVFGKRGKERKMERTVDGVELRRKGYSTWFSS